MALFLTDLDDTLIDREAAFAAWAESLVDGQGLPAGSLECLLDHDFGRGTMTFEGFFGWVVSQYQVPFTRDQLLARFLEDIVTHFAPIDRETVDAMKRLQAAGWKIAIVTNGSTRLQLRKLEVTGIIPFVDGWCISEEACVRKPDPAIFRLAAERCGTTLAGGWMVGDSPDADIAGGRAAGLQTAWIRRGRAWNRDDFVPDLVIDSVAEAVSVILHCQVTGGWERRPE